MLDTELQLKLATEAGPEYLMDYKYHLGMVRDPLPFGQFRFKKQRLDQLYASDPCGEYPVLDGQINRLCLELGY